MKRWLSLLVAVAAAVLITTASAAQRPTAKTHVNFKTPAAVFRYLRAHGVDVRGMVVQHGIRNYAGPRCPGKGWNCTKGRRVIQIATAADASNSFVCSPTSAQAAGTAPPNDCVIVQATPPSGDNNAKCVEQSTAPSVTQNCSITQTNLAGNNNAVVFQLITQGSQAPDSHQNADISQTNGTGKNFVSLAQTIFQSAATNSLTVGQNQRGQQTNTIHQTSDTGNQVSIMAQTVAQKATAGSSYSDFRYTPFAAAAFSGSQNQYGDGVSDTTQTSLGVSQAFNFQNMLQTESAPRFSAVTQSQTGPFRCCTKQQSNLNDIFSIEQAKFQFTSSAAAMQFLDQTGQLDTSGHGHIIGFVDQNGTTQSNSCDVHNGPCIAEQTCFRNTEGPPGCSPPASCNNFGCAPECFPSGCLTVASAARGAPTARLNRYLRSARLAHHFR